MRQVDDGEYIVEKAGSENYIFDNDGTKQSFLHVRAPGVVAGTTVPIVSDSDSVSARRARLRALSRHASEL